MHALRFSYGSIGKCNSDGPAGLMGCDMPHIQPCACRGSFLPVDKAQEKAGLRAISGNITGGKEE